MPLDNAASSPARSRPLLAVFSVAALAALGLAGCATEPAPTPSSSASASGSPTNAPVETETAAPVETIEPGTPITISCDQLLTADDIYAFNSNVSVDPAFDPASSPLTTAAVEDNGIACGYANQTSGETMSFALSQPSPAALTAALNAAVSSSKPVPTYGVPPAVTGFFTVIDGAGEVQIFTPTYWLTARSTMFFEPGDLGELVDNALSHLPE